MISSILMQSGFAAELPNLKGRRFEFTDQINVLFGPNGCGKTTIMKVAAGHTGINTKDKLFSGGWNRPPRGFYGDAAEFPASFKKTTFGEVSADVAWDGQPAFLNSASLSESGLNLPSFVESAEDSPDGMMDMMEQVSLIHAKFSEGEYRLYKIKKVIDTLKKPPVVKLEDEERDSTTQKAYKAYLRTLPRNGRMTLLWDEPDRSLNVKNQIDFWTVFLPNMVRGTNYQIIIATHSLIPLLLPKFEFFNLIDVEPGYYEKSKKDIKALIKIGEDVTSQMADQTKQAAPVEPTPPPTVTKPPRKKTPKKR